MRGAPALAEVAGVALLHDEVREPRAAEGLREAPRRRLVDPHQRGVQHEAALHAEVQRHLQGLHRVVAAIRVAGIIRLAHAGDDVPDAPPVGERGGEGEEDEVAPRHEGVRQARRLEADLGLPRERRVGDGAQRVEGEHVILAEALPPGGVDGREAGAQALPAIELDPVALAVIEAQRLDAGVTVERPGEAGGRILPAGEQDEGRVVSRDALSRHRTRPRTSASR